MKKFSRFAAVCMAAVMALGMSLSASAAVSTATVSATASDTTAVSALTANGTAVSVSPVTEVVVADAQKAAVALVGQSAAVNVGAVQVEKIFELNAALSGPTDITMNIPGITAGQSVVVLHRMSNGVWEVVPVAAVSSGSVTATFTSLSPVAIITYTSPKTGERFPVAGLFCIFSLFGAAYCIKKFLF